MSEIGAADGRRTASASDPIPLRRNGGFRMLWIGQAVSRTGTGAARIAYPLLILALTHSAVIAGIVGTIGLVVRLVLGLPGGALADRYDRRLTMIVCDIARTGVLGVLAVLVLIHLVAWPVVLIVSLIEGAASVLFEPAATAALPNIVADQQLEQAWAITQARNSAANLVGPALGGLLFGLGNAFPFFGDAVSYLISVATVSRISGRFKPSGADKPRALWREVAEGIHLVVRDRLLRAVMLQVPLVTFAFSGADFTVILALRQHGVAPSVIGIAQAAIAAGGLLGAVAAPRLQRLLSLQQTVIMLTVTGTVMFALAARVLPSPLVVIPVAATTFVAPVANAALFSAVLRTTPNELRGRVDNTIDLAASGLAALAPLSAGLIVQHLSGRWALLAFAAAMGAATILCLAVPARRSA